MCEGGDAALERLGDSWSSLSTGSSNAVGARQHLFVKVGGQNVVMLPEDFEPGEYEVICGRGKKSFHHLGNSYLRDVVTGCLERYANASKVEKSVILCDVVDQIRRTSPNGGFVKKDTASGRWFQVDDFLAREKTSQAFRDALHDLYKSSNSSKKKRRHAERTGRHILQYQRENSSSTEDVLGSDQGSFGHTASTCSTTTTNCSGFVAQIPTFATVFTPSASVVGVSALMGGVGVGTHGDRPHMENPFSTISKSKKYFSSTSKSLPLKPKRKASKQSVHLQRGQEPTQQQQSARSFTDPLRRSCPNIKFNCSTGGHDITQGADTLSSLSMQQQLLTKSLQLQMLQEPQQLQQQSTRSVMDPLRRSCPNIKISCDTLGGERNLQHETRATEPNMTMTLDALPVPHELKPMQQPSSCPNIKFNYDVADGSGSFQRELHPEELHTTQCAVPLLQGPQPLQELSAPSVACPLRRSCPNIKFYSNVGDGSGGFQLESYAEEIDTSHDALPDLQKPQQLQEPFVRPDKLRRSCPNIKFNSSGSVFLANNAKELDIAQDLKTTRDPTPVGNEGGSFQLESYADATSMSQGAVPDLQMPHQLQETFVRPDKLRRSCPNIKFKSSGSSPIANKAEEVDITHDLTSKHDLALPLQDLQQLHGASLDSQLLASPSQTKDQSSREDSKPNVNATTSVQQQNHDEILMEKDDFHNLLESMDEEDFEMNDLKYMGGDDFTMDDVEDSREHDSDEVHEGGDMLFNRLVYFAESSGGVCGNPFEPDPIPEIKSHTVLKATHVESTTD